MYRPTSPSHPSHPSDPATTPIGRARHRSMNPAPARATPYSSQPMKSRAKGTEQGPGEKVRFHTSHSTPTRNHFLVCVFHVKFSLRLAWFRGFYIIHNAYHHTDMLTAYHHWRPPPPIPSCLGDTCLGLVDGLNLPSHLGSSPIDSSIHTFSSHPVSWLSFRTKGCTYWKTVRQTTGSGPVSVDPVAGVEWGWNEVV